MICGEAMHYTGVLTRFVGQVRQCQLGATQRVQHLQELQAWHARAGTLDVLIRIPLAGQSLTFTHCCRTRSETELVAASMNARNGERRIFHCKMLELNANYILLCRKGGLGQGRNRRGRL